MVSVGELRYIQAHFETARSRNPDSAVGEFLQLSTRLRCVLRGTLFISKLRSNPFYSYVIQRTKYYDDVFLKAVYGSFRAVLNVGCGTDTRAYRFCHLLKQKGVSVYECDQASAIGEKQAIARRRWPTDHIEYVSVDLNEGRWPVLAAILAKNAQGPTLVLMEGVSPYIRRDSFHAFLGLLGSTLHQGSVVAYDFKRRGVADQFGRSEPGQPVFRLSDDKQELSDFHAPLGYRLEHAESSSELVRRFDPGTSAKFDEDYLVRLVVR
jgi:methyltransferase (TIGR00027 family)